MNVLPPGQWQPPSYDDCLELVQLLVKDGLHSRELREREWPFLDPYIAPKLASLERPSDPRIMKSVRWAATRKLLTETTASIGYYAESALALIGADGSGAKGAELRRRLEVAARKLDRKTIPYFKKKVVPEIAHQITTELLLALYEQRPPTAA